MKILVTGANGFVGRALCGEALARGMTVYGATRIPCDLPVGIENVAVGGIEDGTGWGAALCGIEVVVHLAARVHVMRDEADDPSAEFRRVNVAGTEHLARCAAAAGVKRMIYVSSIGVNGASTPGNARFSEQDRPNPHSPYAVSKWEAEQRLRMVQAETGLQIVIVRPPLVYGAHAPGNFLQMIRAVARGMPLPFGSVRNQRDLIYLGNLVDALLVCATHPAAAGHTYLLSDGESVSTPELLDRTAKALGVRSRVFPFPPSWLQIAGKITRKSVQIEQLLSSLQVDSGKIRRDLGWTPPFTMQQGLEASAGQCGKARI